MVHPQVVQRSNGGAVVILVARFHIPLDKGQIFLANHMTGATKPVFPSNCLAATSKPNLSATKLQHKHPKQRLQKTTNIRETKSNKSKCGLKHL